MKRLIIFSLVLLLIISDFLPAQNWLAKGQTAFFRKRYGEAIKYLDKALESGDSSFFVFYYKGLCYLYTEQFDSALVFLNIAIEKDTTLPDAYNNRGLANLYLGEFKYALDDFSKAIALDSNYGEAYSNRATVYIEMGDFDIALEDLNKAIKLRQTNPLNFFERGRAYYRLKKYKEAISDFDKSIKLGFKNAKVYYNRGNAYFKLENYRKAIEDYTQCLKLDSNEIDALNNRAVAYDKLGMKDKAREDRKRLGRRVGIENLFIPFEETEFVTYQDNFGTFSLQIPSHWKVKETNDIDITELLISPENLNDQEDFYSVGVRITFHFNFSKKYGVKSPEEILDFWRGSIEKNTKDYAFYQYVQQKLFNRGNYIGRLFETVLQIDSNSQYMQFYELAFVKEDKLFYAFFQAPRKQFEFFRAFFDKILQSITFAD